MQENCEKELKQSLSDLLEMFLDLAEGKNSIVENSIGAGMDRAAALKDLDDILGRILDQILLTRKEIALAQKSVPE